MDELERYLKFIVEPTWLEFQSNPTSLRHCYLACVATYHAIDRFSYPRSPANRRNEWRKQSPEFAVIDHVAHDFKHVKSSDQRPTKRPGLPLSFAIYGGTGFNTHILNDTAQVASLRHLVFLVRDAIKFIRQKAAETEKGTRN